MLNAQRFRAIIITAIIVAAIVLARPIVMPIIFSALCAMLMHPSVKKLEKKGLSLTLSSLIVGGIVSVLFIGIFTLLSYEGYKVISSLPSKNIEEITDNPIDKIDKVVAIDLKDYSAHIETVVNKSKEQFVKVIPDTLAGINNSLTFMLTCPIYIFFMLVCRSSIRKFYFTSFKPGNRGIASRILSQIEMVYTSYVKGLSLVIVIVAFLTGLGLFLLGIEHAIFIGILSGLLTLIPYIGVIISALIPIAVALLTKDSYWYVAGVAGIYALVQFLEGNIITPKIMGNQVGVNPLMVILGIVIFGSIGGVIGMLLTVPVLALIKTVAFYVPGWKPIRYLLSVKKN